MTFCNVPSKISLKIIEMTTSTNTQGEHRFLLMLVSVFLRHMMSVSANEREINITPLDPAVCVGANVTFRCSLEDTTTPLEQVKSVILGQEFEGKSDLKSIDEYTTELTLYNLTYKHDHLAVCCILGNNNCDIFAVSMLNVYPLPVEVQNFSCIVEDYIKTMNCSWSYEKEYGRFKMPEVILQWKPRNELSWKICSDLSREYGYCYWERSKTDEDFAMKVINIVLTLKQKCKISVASVFKIDTSKIVKPDPVTDLSSKVLNSTCIHIMWRSTSSEKIYPKEHRVAVSSKWGDNRDLHFNTTTDTENLTQSNTFCSLHPYTRYTFTVSTRPTGEQAGYFSIPKSIVAVTYSDKPSASPKVTEGGYHWHRKDCEGNRKTRRVCIFWKPLKEEEENGDIKGLHVSYAAINRNGQSVQKDWAEDLTYECINNLLCDAKYHLSIKAENGNGTSEQDSTLSISSATAGVPQPIFIVESSNKSQIFVNMEDSESFKANAFIVAWCLNQNGVCKKDHEVQWQHFPWKKEEAVIEINPANSPQDFLYGVSVLTEKDSSGLDWQDCVYMKNIEPKREPGNVVVSEGHDDNTLVVSWDKLACESGEPYISIYNVRYNKLGDKNRKSYSIKTSGEAMLILKDLEEDQIYEVTVRGITKDGLYGPESLPKTGIPISKSLKTGTIVGISLTVLVFVMFSGIGCYCVIRGCRKKANYAIQKATKITLPSLNHNNFNLESESPSNEMNDTDFDNTSDDQLDVTYSSSQEMEPKRYCVSTVSRGISEEDRNKITSPDTGYDDSSLAKAYNGLPEGEVTNLTSQPDSDSVATTLKNITDKGRNNSTSHDTGLDSHSDVTECNDRSENGINNPTSHDTGLNSYSVITASNDTSESGRTNYTSHDTGLNSYSVITASSDTSEIGRTIYTSHDTGLNSYSVITASNDTSERGRTNYTSHDTGLNSYSVITASNDTSESGRTNYTSHDTGLDSYTVITAFNDISESRITTLTSRDNSLDKK